MNNPALIAGDTIRIVKVISKTYEWMDGAEFVLMSPPTNQCVQVPGQGWIYCEEWEKVEPINRYTMPDSTADMATELAQLRIDLATAQRDRDLMHEQRNKMQNDFDKIAKALAHESEERQWCDEYTEFVSDLNTRLTVFQFELPTVEYEVQLQRVRTVYEQVSVTVTLARGAETREIHSAAIEEAWNAYDWDAYDDEVSDDYDIVDVTEL